MTLRKLVVFGAVVILLGVFWTAVWQGMDRSVLSRVPILDEAHYLQRAVEIQEQAWLPEAPFTMSPLYSYLVALTGSGRLIDEHRVRAGSPPRGIRGLQALLWAGTAVLLWRVGRDLFGPRWGWGPPLLWVGYAPAAILAGQVLMEIPLTFAATLALAVSAGHVGPASPTRRALLAGALVGAAFLLRGTAIVLVVPVMLALWPERSWRRTLGPVLLALVLVVLPFTLLNSVRAGHPVPPALNGGVNLYIGNGPGANGFFRAFPGFDVETDPSGAVYLSTEMGRTIPDAVTADRTWTAEARAAMAADPARVLGLWVRKVRLHFVGAEIPQISAFGAWLRYVPVLRGLIVPWALLAVAGLAGGVLAWRRQPGLRPWLVAALLLIAVQSLFFVVTRYRVILVPTLTLATVALARELVRRRGRDLVIAMALVVLASVAVWPWGLAGTLHAFAAGGLDNEAVRWEHVASAVTATDATRADEELAEAETLYRRSIAVAPDRPDPWRGLARVLWARGDLPGATDQLEAGLGQVSETRDLRRDLIGMLIRQGRGTDALPHLERALANAPHDAEILHNLMLVLVRADRLEEATRVARELVASHPDAPRSHLDLGVVLGKAGHLRAAEAAFSAGVARFPNHPELNRNLDGVRELLAGERQ